MKKSVYSTLLFLVVPATISLVAPAQQADEKPVVTIKAQAREVLLPVTVRDKHGALVANLQKGGFTLTEDGRTQAIKSFTRESNFPFRVGLLVDTSRSVSSAMDAERKAAGKFVDLMLPADPKAAKDQAFLIHFDREVELLQDFTSSRDKMHHELDSMGPSRAQQQDTSSSSSDPSNNNHGGGRGGGYGGGQQQRGNRAGTLLYDAIFLAGDELMQSKDGRKALVILSDGEDRGSRETLNDAVDAADRANLAVYTIYFKGEQERSSGNGFPGSGGHHGGMGGGWPGGGGGYPGGGGGYPGGGGRRGGSEQSSVDGKKIMQKIAERTGGRFYEAKKKDNLEDIYNQIAEELRGQYLLTYTPDQVDSEGGFHKVVLKANKGDYEVVTREGYYAPAAK